MASLNGVLIFLVLLTFIGSIVSIFAIVSAIQLNFEQ